MPQVMNGCGTWYYGKRNRTQYTGVCRACGSTATLTSYDTRLFVVVFFIPVIPLARKRIIEECSICTRHAPVPLDDWRRAVRRTEEAAAAYRAAPTDATLAGHALVACASNRDQATFLALGGDIERHLSGDYKTLRLLGAVHGLFNRLGDTERLLRASLAIEDEEETREALADCLLQLGRPADAEPFLRHIVDQGIPDRADRLFQLAQGYQIVGDHKKALAVFDQCDAVNPLLGRDQNFVRLREASAKAAGTGTPVRPAEVVQKAKSAAATRRFLKLAPAVLLLALLAYLGLAFIQGRRREVFLVSGVGRPYTVRLNGQPRTLAPGSITPVRLPEGNVTVEWVDPPNLAPAETVSIRTPLFSRPFRSQAFVINPDRAAVLQHAQITYASGGGTTPPEPGFSAGRTLHEFGEIDYAFTEPPSRLSVKAGSGPVTKRTLSIPRRDADVPPTAVLAILAPRIGPDAIAEAARRRLTLEPDQHDFLQVLSAAATPQQVADFLRPSLAVRPLRVQWHRAYQDALMEMRRDADLVREYDALLAAEPANKDLMYLAGRASNDTDRSLDLCRRAAEGDAPSAHAAFSLCSYHLSNGEFPQAVRFGELAVRTLPGEAGFRSYLKWALFADRQFDKALEVITAEQSGPLALAMPAYSDEIALRCARGDREKGQQAISALQLRLHRRDPAAANRQSQRLQTLVSYASGNLAEFYRAAEAAVDPDDLFAARVTRGDPAALDADFAKDSSHSKESSAHRHLIAYIAAIRQNRTDLADRHLRAAADVLAEGRHEERAVAAALRGKPEIPSAELLRLRGHPLEKRVWVAALGLRDPALRDACFALSRKLNFDPRFPHLLLNDVFGKPGGR